VELESAHEDLRKRYEDEEVAAKEENMQQKKRGATTSLESLRDESS
jgi:hypothetical protein